MTIAITAARGRGGIATGKGVAGTGHAASPLFIATASIRGSPP